MGAITERLVLRRAAAAERERALCDRVGIPIPVDQRDIVAFDEIRTVLSHFDVRHQLIFCIADKKSAFDGVFFILSRSNSMASTCDSGLSTLRRTQMRFSSSRGMSSSSLRVPLFWMSI